jgi:acyl dehydratase
MLPGGEMETYQGAAALEAAIGTEVGPTDWFTIDQNRINGFADVTEDHQWIHIDTDRAAAGPFGKTIAHGFLTLSLLSHLVSELRRIEGARMGHQLRPEQGAVPCPGARR